MAADDDLPSRGDFAHLSRAVEKLTHTIEGLPDKVAATYVRKDVYLSDQRVHDTTHARHDEELDSLLGFKEWAIRLVIGAVILALLGLVLVQGGGA